MRDAGEDGGGLGAEGEEGGEVMGMRMGRGGAVDGEWRVIVAGVGWGREKKVRVTFNLLGGLVQGPGSAGGQLYQSEY